MGLHAGYRFRPLLVSARLPGGVGLVQQGGRRDWRPVVAPVARGDDPGPRRRPRAGAGHVGSHPSIRRSGLAACGRQPAPGPPPRARRDRCRAGARRPAHEGERPPASRLADRRSGGESSRRPGGSDRDPLPPRGGWPGAPLALVAALAVARRTGPHERPIGAVLSPATVDGPVLVLMAVAGAIAGSFLNVCIHRIPRGASIVWPASRCPSCLRALAWYENVPIVSYLLLRGRCRTCRAGISIRYPIVEAVTAVLFATGWLGYGAGGRLVSRLGFGCALGGA